MLNQSINIALVQQVANLHVVIDLSVVNLLATQKSCEQVANWLETSCQPELATSFQLVRLVVCGLNKRFAHQMAVVRRVVRSAVASCD